MPISKLQWWLWVLYLTIGAGAIVVYRDSTVQFLLASYFCIYALMGFLWHCRELHVATLWAATPDQVCSLPHSQLLQTVTNVSDGGSK